MEFFYSGQRIFRIFFIEKIEPALNYLRRTPSNFVAKILTQVRSSTGMALAAHSLFSRSCLCSK